MKKKRLKKKAYLSLLTITFISFLAIIFLVYRSYTNSNKYLLLELGYAPGDVVEYLKNPKLVKILLKNEYNKDIVDFINEEYFIEDNIKDYLNYKKEYNNKSNKEIVSIINVGSNKKWYEGSIASNLDKGILVLANKFNYLPNDYKPDDLENISLMYAFSGKEIRKEVHNSFVLMSKAAKKEGLTIIANSAFRDFDYQYDLYYSYKRKFGVEEADGFAARPGFSEHQTGLAVDVSTLNSTMDNFHETEEFEWLTENAHKYGFILRYPKGKEHLTGYNYESWHYRYVGIDVASEIKKKGITFDEYYAYYLR